MPTFRHSASAGGGLVLGSSSRAGSINDPEVPWSDRYRAVRDVTEALAAPLSAEDQQIQSMPDTSPTKWHRAHTTWFFETFILEPFVSDYQAFDPAFGFLFNSYYETVGARHPRPTRGLLSRPSAADVADYRARVDDAMLDLLTAPALPTNVLELAELGLHHEQQHQELLLMDIKHVLSVNPLRPGYLDRPHVPSVRPVPPHEWIPHDGGVVTVGHDGDGFAFDHEGPRHDVLLQPFAVADRQVTAGEWLEFMADDGYQRHELWRSDGWAACNQQHWEAPLYWELVDDNWHVFTLDGLRPVDPAEPVCHVSFVEADAFASWAGARLPTEHEWEVIAADELVQGNLLETGELHPLPGHGTNQLFGDTWEWTASPFTSYPGFRAADGAVGEYNGKFMLNQFVLRGGCALTPPGHVRAAYRNFFYPTTRWHMSGLRLARDQRTDDSAGPSSGLGATNVEPVIDVHLDPAWIRPALGADVASGLTSTPKELQPKWFYDERGSELYDQITRLPEYYPFRREHQILEIEASAIAAVANVEVLVELGSGTSEKTRVLLDALRERGGLSTYVPFDVSEPTLRAAAADLAREYPGLRVHGVVGDFDHHLGEIPTGGRKLVALLGGTIGNFAPQARARFLKDIATSMAPGDHFLLGTDLVKDTDRLVAAYDDASGVTAAFNQNVLHVINSMLDADFDVDAFLHEARYDDDHEWIEMHLVSTRDQRVRVGDLDLDVDFAEGEAMRTEISAKFRPERVERELRSAGLEPVKWLTDPDGDFALSLSVR